jgi:hypothetical protein
MSACYTKNYQATKPPRKNGKELWKLFRFLIVLFAISV